MKIAIISGATEDYLEKLIILYKSLRTFHKDIYFIPYLIGDKNIDIKKNTYFRSIYRHKSDKFLIYNKDTIKFINNDHKRAYSSNIRIKYLLNHYKDYDAVLWFDADSVIIKSLDLFFNNFKKHKVFAFDKYSRYDHIKETNYLSGIIGFKKSNESEFILSRWYDHLFKIPNNNWKWGYDQKYLKIFLDLALKKYNNNFYYNFPFTYISWMKFKNAHIVVGKGVKKFNKNYLSIENKFK